ncbi:MAG: glycosyltransferase family 9 protein [Elusimicrobiota bacterium]|jgi:ADP-heptose:LPS heptosyltransferase|nr:glycosyltransferase family 9 protein [Elusimicrobiota bacterium]
MKKTVFFNMNQLGDLLFALPIIKAAKDRGDSYIYSIVPPALSPILEASGLIDGFIDKKMPLFKLIKEIKTHHFDKAILFSESPSSLLAAYFAQIKERIGFKSASLNFLLTKKALKTGVPSLINNKRLAAAADLTDIKDDYTDIIKIPQKNIDEVKIWLANNGLNPQNSIVFSTGASKKRKNKRLPNEIWVQIINSLSEKGFSCILSGAPYEKEDMSKLSAMCLKNHPQIFCGQNGILDNAALLKMCRLFIGIDSGAMHLSAALSTKCIALFSKTDPNQVGPMPLQEHIIVKKDDISLFDAKEIVPQALLALKQ